MLKTYILKIQNVYEIMKFGLIPTILLTVNLQIYFRELDICWGCFLVAYSPCTDKQLYLCIVEFTLGLSKNFI